MHPSTTRAWASRDIRIAAESLVSASERLWDLRATALSGQLLDRAIELQHLAREVLQDSQESEARAWRLSQQHQAPLER